jgi:hypothetical protein
MKLFSGWMVPAALVLTAAAANAQTSAPHQVAGSRYSVVSDFDGPYEGMPQEGMPQEAPPPRYGGPMLLAPEEIYAILRENGFSPLGIPQQRGFVYTIAVIDRGGDDGRLVIDARTGRIIRFMPAYRMGGHFHGDLRVPFGPMGALPPVSAVRGPPRPPGSVPHFASRAPAVPLPKAAPPRAGEAPKPMAATPAPETPVQQSAAVQAKPVEPPAASQAAAPVETKPAAPPLQPTQQSAAVQAKPADAPTAPQAAAPAPVEAKPAAPPVQPTQEMPKVQGLE